MKRYQDAQKQTQIYTKELPWNTHMLVFLQIFSHRVLRYCYEKIIGIISEAMNSKEGHMSYKRKEGEMKPGRR